MLPKISVIMPTYNESRKELNESIDSVLKQTYKNFDLVIVDDNPNSLDLKSYLEDVSNRHDDIKIVFDKKNLKEGAANNAVKAADGTFIARMDADDISYKNRLQDQYKFLVTNNLDLVYSNFSLISTDGQLTRRRTYDNKDEVNQSNIKKIVSYGNTTVGPTFFFKKDIFQSLGGYRKINGEDYDLVARFLIHNYQVGFQANPVIFKRLRKSSITYHGLLPQYVSQRTISDYLKGYRYKKVMPLSVLKNNWTSVTTKQIDQFKRYANARYSFNDKKTIFNLLRVVKSIFLSKIVFQRCLWSIINKYRISRY